MHKYTFITVAYKEDGPEGHDLRHTKEIEAENERDARRKVFEQTREVKRWVRSMTLKMVNGVPVPYDV